jgi:hypothetical protein
MLTQDILHKQCSVQWVHKYLVVRPVVFADSVFDYVCIDSQNCPYTIIYQCFFPHVVPGQEAWPGLNISQNVTFICFLRIVVVRLKLFFRKTV